MLLPHAANEHVTAKSGEKKRREFKFSHKGKKELQIKFPGIPGSLRFLIVTKQTKIKKNDNKQDRYGPVSRLL